MTSAAARARTGDRLLGASVLVVAVVLVGAPLVALIVGALTSGPIGDPGRLTAGPLRTLLDRPSLGSTLASTALHATGAAVFATALGAGLAWVTERTDVPGRSVLRLLAILPLVVPGLVTTSAWSLVLNPTIGLGNDLLAALGSSTPILDGHTMAGMIWVDAADGFSVPYLLVAAALRRRDATLEEAAAVVGAGRLRTLGTITVPLLVPALVAGGLLVLLRSAEGLQVPAILGLPGGIRVLASEIYLATRRFPTDLNLAAAFALLHLALTLLALATYRRVVAREATFRALAARGAGTRPRALGRARPAITVLAWGAVVATVIVPTVTMLLVSMMPFYRPPSRGGFTGLDLEAYARVLADPRVRRAVGTTLEVTAWATAAVLVLGAVLAWVVIRRPTRAAVLADGVATLPLAIPDLVLGLAVIWVGLRLPFELYGTPGLISIAFTIAFLPYAVRMLHAALVQMDPVLEDAARVAGGGPVRTLIGVVGPLLLPAIAAVAVLVVSRAVHALSLPALLAWPGVEALSVVVLDLHDQSRFPEVQALGVLMTLAVTALVGTAALGRGLARRWSHGAPA